MALGPQSPASSATSVTLGGGGSGAGIGGTVVRSGESAHLTLDTNLRGAMLSPHTVENNLYVCVSGRVRKGVCVWIDGGACVFMHEYMHGHMLMCMCGCMDGRMSACVCHMHCVQVRSDTEDLDDDLYGAYY